MSQVYILSEGEKCEGEHVIAVYGTWDAAITALKSDLDYVDAAYREDGDVAIVESGAFYTIVRMHEVES